jgi:hypothetical protein
MTTLKQVVDSTALLNALIISGTTLKLLMATALAMWLKPSAVHRCSPVLAPFSRTTLLTTIQRATGLAITATV